MRNNKASNIVERIIFSILGASIMLISSYWFWELFYNYSRYYDAANGLLTIVSIIMIVTFFLGLWLIVGVGDKPDNSHIYDLSEMD